MTNILYLIDENYASFSKNEKKLSRFILNSPHKVISMSNQEIAKELEMSVSTLNRYSQKLINQSFHEVRSQLAMLFPKQQAPYKIELLNNESVDTLKETLSSCEEALLKVLHLQITQRLITYANILNVQITSLSLVMVHRMSVRRIYIKNYLELG